MSFGRCPVHIIRLHAHPMPRRAPQGVDRYWCEYIQVQVPVLILPSTNTEYRRRRRQKQTATTRPGTSRQEAGRRSRTEVVRFPFAARLNELHRLRGCGWVWWRERGLGKGARGAWKDFVQTTPPAQVDDTCASLERQETAAAWGVAAVRASIRTGTWYLLCCPGAGVKS